MIKKRWLILISLIFSISIITLVSAQYSGYGTPFYLDLGVGVNQILDQMVRFMTPLFEFIIGPYSTTSFFFQKVLVLFLLIIIIYFILDHVPLFEGYRTISMLISFIVSVIAIRFISENDFFTGILLPYGALGIAITTLVPFFIFAYGIHTTQIPGVGRKIAWLLFGSIYFMLWVTRYSQLDSISQKLYLGVMILMGLMLVFDRSIHAYFRGLDIKQFQKDANDAEIANLQAELARLGQSNVTSPEMDARKRRIERRLRHLGSRYQG